MTQLPLIWRDDPNFTGMFTRTMLKQLLGSGGLWEIAAKYYPLLGAKSVKMPQPMYTFPSGARLRYSQISGMSDAESLRGLQLSYLAIDELTQLDQKSVQFLLTCLRSEANMNSICVASCNPHKDSWVFDLVSWYLDDKGFVDKEKNGKTRYYVVNEGQFIFADEEEWFKENLPDCVTNSQTGEYIPPKKFCFVQLTIFNNPILLKKNPRYLSELQNLPPHERDAQLYGNWFATAEKPDYFNRTMVQGKHGERIVPFVPIGSTRVRAWDKAATQFIPKINNTDADFSACIAMAKDRLGNYYIYADFCKDNYDEYEKVYGKFRKNSAQRDQIMMEQAKHDGRETYLVIAKDAAADGKTVYEQLSRMFLSAGFKVKPSKSSASQSKWTRFEPFLCACQAGLVHIVESSFPDKRTLELFYAELEAFNPDPTTGKWRSGRYVKDDWLDSCSDAFLFLSMEKIYTVPKLGSFSPPPISVKAIALADM